MVYESKNQLTSFKPPKLMPCYFTFSSDNTLKFIPQPFLSTTKMVAKSEELAQLFEPPELVP